MRTNQQWLDELSGKHGKEIQQTALNDLGKELYTHAYHHLLKIQTSKAVLKGLAASEISDFAKDFAQDAVEKIAHKNFALLEKYQQKGSFKAWVATVTTRIIASELRRPFWERRTPMSAKIERKQQEEKYSPEVMASIAEVRQALQSCIQKLPERSRIVFIRCTIENEPAEILAEEFETTANAIHILNFRTREKLSKCMQQKGFDQDSLNIFEN